MRHLLILFLLSSSALAQTRTAATRTAAGARTAAGTRSTATRNDLDRLWVLKGNPTKGVTTISTGPCASVSTAVGGFVGPTALCLKPDGTSAGTQVDGGALVEFSAGVITPATVTASRCPNGPECDAVTFQRFDGGTGAQWVTANTASIEGDLSCVVMARRWGAATTHYHMTKTVGSGGPLLSYLSSNTFTAQIIGLDAGVTTVIGAANTQLFGAWETYGFTYDYTADLDSDLTVYVGGSSSGTPSTTAVGPLRTTATPWRISGYSATAGFLDGDIAFAACSEDAWTAAEHLAIATAMRAVWTEQVGGSAITFTRASTAYCDPLDGGYGTWLRNNEPCIVGGAYLSEPAATNRALYSNAFDTAATWVPLGAIGDGGVASSMEPTVTANSTDVLDPVGTYTAEKIAFPATVWAGDATALQQGFTGTAAAWSGRVYSLRTLSGTATVYLYAYTGASAPPTNALATCAVTTTWAECKWTNATLAAATYQYSLGVDLRATIGTGQSAQSAQTIYAWQAQAELGSVATSPIENAGSALTRAIAYATVPNSLFGVDPSAWCFEGRLDLNGRTWTAYGGNQYLAAAGAHSAANSWRFYVAATTDLPTAFIIDAAGGTQTLTADVAISAGAKTLAVCTSAGTPTLYVDGVLTAATSGGAGTGIITTQPATIYLNSAYAVGGTPIGYGSAWRIFTGGYR